MTKSWKFKISCSSNTVYTIRIQQTTQKKHKPKWIVLYISPFLCTHKCWQYIPHIFLPFYLFLCLFPPTNCMIENVIIYSTQSQLNIYALSLWWVVDVLYTCIFRFLKTCYICVCILSMESKKIERKLLLQRIT